MYARVTLKSKLKDRMWEEPGVITAVTVGVSDVRLCGSGAYFNSCVHGGMTYKVEYTNIKVIVYLLGAY
jgi:hypothetical protein